MKIEEVRGIKDSKCKFDFDEFIKQQIYSVSRNRKFEWKHHDVLVT